MSHNYYLSVAGIKLLFEADRPLIENKEFLPFLVDEIVPDLYVHITVSDELPVLPSIPVYADQFCAVAKDSKDRIQKFFFDSVGGPYTVATYDLDDRQVWIEYPVIRKNDELQLQNCFYFLGFEEYALGRNKLCLHASCVDTPLGGILFSGVSGIGKSTQAELWCRYRGARQINGDRPILSKEGQTWLAWGSPYAGSSKVYVNDSCPVSAIVLLKQAKACSLRRLSPSEAFRGVWAGLTIHSWDAAFVEKASALAVELIQTVPVYEFSCTPDETAVVYLEQILRKELKL